MIYTYAVWIIINENLWIVALWTLQINIGEDLNIKLSQHFHRGKITNLLYTNSINSDKVEDKGQLYFEKKKYINSKHKDKTQRCVLLQ